MRNNLHETALHYRETDPDMFQIGDLITCPSDGTGAIWRVKEKKPNGVIKAELASYEALPENPYYPREMTITPEAFHGWKKMSG